MSNLQCVHFGCPYRQTNGYCLHTACMNHMVIERNLNATDTIKFPYIVDDKTFYNAGQLTDYIRSVETIKNRQSKEPVNPKSWKEFKDAGLLWFANTILHAFGWALVLNIDDGEVVSAYPARVTFRGFGEASNTQGYIKLSKYMSENADKLLEESKT